MNEVKEAPRPLGGTEPKGSGEGPFEKVGWDVAVLVIIGVTLALAGVALLVVGSLMH